jgi:hypothetical protein
MQNPIDRRSFIRSAALASSGLFATSLLAQTAPTAPVPAVPATPAKKPAPRPPALVAEKVQATVGQAHRSLDAVKALIAENALLVNACWDWGGGDFETPLQAAAHTGGREIAEFLLEHNARLDIYAAGMLGMMGFVQAAMAANPQIHLVPGPHGFTLLHCVKQGGEKSKALYDWLVAQGVPEVFQRPLPYVWPAGNEPKAG